MARLYPFNPLRCVIMGPPGSGKGTIADRIVKKFDVTHVSTATVLRRHIINETELGKECEVYLHSGALVPDNLISKIMLAVMEGLTQRNWILEGYPRTIYQAKLFEEHHPPNHVLSIHVPFEQLIERLKERQVHEPSGRVYHEIYDPPIVPGKDDVTGEPLVQRQSDQPDKVKRRLEAYVKWCKRVADFYEERNLLVRFSGEDTNSIYPKVEAYIKDNLPKDYPGPSAYYDADDSYPGGGRTADPLAI